MIQKKKIALLVLLLSILIGLRAFELTPLGNPSKFLSLVVSTIGFGVFVIHYRRFPKRLRQFSLLFIALFFSSILSSYLIHGQSIKHAFVASSDIYLVGISFLIYYLILKYKITLNEIKTTIISTAWFLFICYLIIYFLDVTFTSADGEESFGMESLRKGVVTFASIIYLTDFFQKNNTKYLVYSLLLFSINQLGDFQRFIMLVYIICLLALIIHFGKRAVAIKIATALLVIIPVSAIILTTTPFGATITQKIDDAIELFDEDKEYFTDASIEARVWQTEAALESIRTYPITGVGRIHNSQVEKIIGLSYFHISDIGLIGIMFSYGLLGIFIFIKQIAYLVAGFRRKTREGKIQFIEFKYFMLYLMLHTILTGRSLNMPQEFMIIITFIEVGNLRTLTAKKSTNDQI